MGLIWGAKVDKGEEKGRMIEFQLEQTLFASQPAVRQDKFKEGLRKEGCREAGLAPWCGAATVFCTQAVGATEDGWGQERSFITATSTTFKDDFSLRNSPSPVILWGLVEKTKPGRNNI